MNTTDLMAPGKHPIRVAQFGTGNFLRAFADYMIDVANEKGCFDGDVVMVKQVPGKGSDRLAAQGGTYHVILQGKQDGKIVDEVRTITAVRGTVNPYTDYEAYQTLAKLESLRFVISNTTEAGIVYDETDQFETLPAVSYPGRLVQFLYERWQAFHGDPDKGLIILPVELIEDNGKVLKECCVKLIKRWNLGEDFLNWVENANVFTSTLVDRIVSGKSDAMSAKFPEDSMYVVAEPFGLWIIASDKDITADFPLDKAGMPVVFTDDLKPFRERKVRVLNGTHTAMAMISYLCGVDIVADAMKDELLRKYVDHVSYEELAPAVPQPIEETREFADEVMERFENPFLNHKLLDISLNSVSKWRARDLPTVCDTIAAGKDPKVLVFSLAALLAFDTIAADEDGQYYGKRPDGSLYPIREDRKVVETVQVKDENDLKRVLADESLWGVDLSGLSGQVYASLNAIRQDPRKAVEEILSK
ncbi:MAG: tagaturonate reductase [Anaerolineaceae bacterium]|nr:tagaturonate reductase [Anaerolineaceae bacterium]